MAFFTVWKEISQTNGTDALAPRAIRSDRISSSTRRDDAHLRHIAAASRACASMAKCSTKHFDLLLCYLEISIILVKNLLALVDLIVLFLSIEIVFKSFYDTMILYELVCVWIVSIMSEFITSTNQYFYDSQFTFTYVEIVRYYILVQKFVLFSDTK